MIDTIKVKKLLFKNYLIDDGLLVDFERMEKRALKEEEFLAKQHISDQLNRQ